MAEDASFQQLLNAAFDHNTNNFFTAIPAVVVTVRDGFQNLTIDAQPAINDLSRDGTITERPVLMNIPVQMPASSTSAITFPLNVGDSVLLIFSMRGLDAWKRSNGRPTTPTDYRKFDKRDALAIPFQPPTNSPNQQVKHLWPHNPQDLTITHNLSQGTEVEIRLKQDGKLVINTHAGVEVNCKTAEVFADESIGLNTAALTLNASNTTVTGNMDVAGTLTAGGIVFNTHKHGSSPGPSN